MIIIDYLLALAYGRGLKIWVSKQDLGPCPVSTESGCSE